MKSLVPRIGFDRCIQHNWATAALQVRGGLLSLEQLQGLLAEGVEGTDARRKTLLVLKRLWLEPRAELVDYVTRGAELSKAQPEESPLVWNWGVAIAAYPFFGKVAELVGRLSDLHGDCTTAEIHRRISEIYGESVGTARSTSRVFQSLESWGCLERVEKDKRLLRLPTLAVKSDRAVSWLLEGALRYTGKALGVQTLQALAVLYPFTFEQPLGYLVANSPTLEVQADGSGNLCMALR